MNINTLNQKNQIESFSNVDSINNKAVELVKILEQEPEELKQEVINWIAKSLGITKYVEDPNKSTEKNNVDKREVEQITDAIWGEIENVGKSSENWYA